MADGQRCDGLVGDAALADSAVVANCLMNRERQLAGVNSYARELGFSPLDVVTARVSGGDGDGGRDRGDGSGAGAVRER